MRFWREWSLEPDVRMCEMDWQRNRSALQGEVEMNKKQTVSDGLDVHNVDEWPKLAGADDLVQLLRVRAIAEDWGAGLGLCAAVEDV
jgi:hypothetical protein